MTELQNIPLGHSVSTAQLIPEQPAMVPSTVPGLGVGDGCDMSIEIAFHHSPAASVRFTVPSV
jgi:hypothetical protein